MLLKTLYSPCGLLISSFWNLLIKELHLIWNLILSIWNYSYFFCINHIEKIMALIITCWLILLVCNLFIYCFIDWVVSDLGSINGICSFVSWFPIVCFILNIFLHFFVCVTFVTSKLFAYWQLDQFMCNFLIVLYS